MGGSEENIACPSSSGSSTLTLRVRFTRFGATSTTTGFTDARSSIGFKYIPVADSGASAMRSGGPSAMIRPPFTPPPGPSILLSRKGLGAGRAD